MLARVYGVAFAVLLVSGIYLARLGHGYYLSRPLDDTLPRTGYLHRVGRSHPVAETTERATQRRIRGTQESSSGAGLYRRETQIAFGGLFDVNQLFARVSISGQAVRRIDGDTYDEIMSLGYSDDQA